MSGLSLRNNESQYKIRFWLFLIPKTLNPSNINIKTRRSHPKTKSGSLSPSDFIWLLVPTCGVIEGVSSQPERDAAPMAREAAPVEELALGADALQHVDPLAAEVTLLAVLLTPQVLWLRSRSCRRCGGKLGGHRRPRPLGAERSISHPRVTSKAAETSEHNSQPHHLPSSSLSLASQMLIFPTEKTKILSNS